MKQLRYLCSIIAMIFVVNLTSLVWATDVETISGKQLDRIFPQKSDELDDSLIMNNLCVVNTYAGQGKLAVNPQGTESFELYINGKKFEVGNEPTIVDFSEIAINGANSIEVTNIEPKGATVNIKADYPELLPGDASEYSDKRLDFIDELLEAEVEYGFPGGQLVVVKNGKIIKNSTYGYINNYSEDGKIIENRKPVAKSTMYDLASNTKMYACNFAIQKLVSEEKIAITDLVNKFFPEFKDEPDAKIKGKSHLTIQNIMEHQAGFPADPQYFNENYDKDDGISNGKNDLYSVNKKDTLKMIMKTPLQYEPGTNTVYSDVDYMLLGLIVEKVTGQSLDKYVEKEIYEPLKLQHICFNPLSKGFAKDDCAATELNGNSRDGAVTFKVNRSDTIQGEVHDEKAFYSMEGVSGHAGLFSSAEDLAVLTQVMLNGGGYGAHKFFDKNVIDQFTKPKFTNITYGLGWRRMGDQGYPWYFSPVADAATYGHTGWTGTLTVIDPQQQMSIIWLSNKINSPVVDPKKDPNYFLGNHFLGGTYGAVSSLVYLASYSHVEDLDDLLLQMIRDRIELMKSNEDYQNRGDEAALNALFKVATVRAEAQKSAKIASKLTELINQAEKTPERSDFLKRLAVLK